MLVLGAVLFLVFFLAVGFWLAQKLPDGLGDAITTMSIGLTFLQIIASTASVSIIDWPPEVVYVLDLAAAAMLDAMLRRDPRQRATAAEAVAHPFVCGAASAERATAGVVPQNGEAAHSDEMQ